MGCWFFLFANGQDSKDIVKEVEATDQDQESDQEDMDIESDNENKENNEANNTNVDTVNQPATKSATPQPSFKEMDAATIDALSKTAYYIPDYHDRYVKYYGNHSDWPLRKIVMYVNASRDMTRYVDVRNADLSKGILTLVGKYDYLGQYAPDDLVQLSDYYSSGSTRYLRKEAAEQFMKMADAARLEGLVLKNVSGYRSYSVQASLYKRYVAQDGTALADTYSSRAGYSEHQLGLATDINSVSDSFAYTKEYQWLQQHAAEYGFIMRYPKGLEDITGFTYEPWHYRYVGVTAAKQIVAEGITFDEYYAYYIGK